MLDGEADALRSTAHATNHVAKMQQLIRSHAPDRWLTIEQASELLGSTPRTVQRRLLAQKTTYSALVQDIRGQMAEELLQNTDITMAEIAHALGYRHQGDFSRAFRLRTGVTPSDFRRQRT